MEYVRHCGILYHEVVVADVPVEEVDGGALVAVEADVLAEG